MPAVDTLHEALVSARLLPTVTPQSALEVRSWADACIAVGIPALELLLRGEGAETLVLSVIRGLAASHASLLIGVGSVYDAATARRMLAGGARFIVSPIMDAGTGEACRESGAGWLPGAFTPTEIALAERAGAGWVKLFPAHAIDAPAFVRAVLGPSPSARIVPTNVALEEIPALLAAGAAAFGLGGRFLAGTGPTDTAAITARLRAARAAAGA